MKEKTDAIVLDVVGTQALTTTLETDQKIDQGIDMK